MDLPVSLGGHAEEADLAEQTVETLDKYIAKWRRSRKRDGDAEFMAGRRAGWVDMIADILGKPRQAVFLALEMGELK